mgnify:CR=1 FL=1
MIKTIVYEISCETHCQSYIYIQKQLSVDRKCIRCNLNDIDDEFVLVCPEYINLRSAYIPKYYSNRPSVLTFIELVQTKNKPMLIEFSIYCIKAFVLRNS